MWTHSSFAKKDTLLPTVAPLEIIIPNRSASPSVEQEHELVSALTAFKCLSTVCVCALVYARPILLYAELCLTCDSFLQVL